MASVMERNDESGRVGKGAGGEENDKDGEDQRREVRPASGHHSWEPKCFLISKQ